MKRKKRITIRLHLRRLWAALLVSWFASGVDAATDGAWDQSPLACYEVPALSSIPRLPDALPSDGRLSSQLRLVAAKGEFEPVSFVIAPRSDVAKLVLKASADSVEKGEAVLSDWMEFEYKVAELRTEYLMDKRFADGE